MKMMFGWLASDFLLHFMVKIDFKSFKSVLAQIENLIDPFK